MGWSTLLSALVRVPSLAQRNDDDFYDRLNHRWTTGIIIMFAVLVTTKTYVRDEPITCWAPKEFEKGWVKYVNSYCWISNTYYVPFTQEIPKSLYARRQKNQIIYYQWVPLMLLVQALMFYAPICIWRSINDRSGIDINDIVETAEKYQYCPDADVREKVMQHLLKQMHRSMKAPKRKYGGTCKEGCRKWFKARCSCCRNNKHGNYMVIMYIMVKILFLINCIGQLFMLNYFLGQNFTMYGFEVLKAFHEGRDMEESPRFPRVTICDFAIRRVGNVHWYSLQCVLPINMYNERIYLFMWFWILIVSLMTFVGFIIWMLRLILPSHRKNYIQKNLDCFEAKHRIEDLIFEEFTNKYLKSDGYLVMRLVDLNTDKVTLQDFLIKLWEKYKRHYKATHSVSSGLIRNYDVI